ncbi:hypothetical protein TNCV_1912111 [Trichonephila clavipes]|nr:hypothetical protein TNCV_1912111 [Trichonephila clavipes]
MIVGSSGQRMLLPQKRTGFGWIRGTTEREDRSIQSMAVAHRTVSTAEIRAAVGTTVTQGTVRNRLFQGQLRSRAL